MNYLNNIMKDFKENIYNYCVGNNLDYYVDVYIKYCLLTEIKNNFNISISNEMIDLEYALGKTRL
jgi:hypothetical protein